MALSILFLMFILQAIDRLVGKRLEPGFNVMESDGQLKYRVGTFIILLLFLIGGYALFDIENIEHFRWLLVFFFIAYWSFQSWMEFKYVEGKKYLLSLSLMVVGVMAVSILFYVHGIITNTTLGEEFSAMMNKSHQINDIEIFWTKKIEKEGYIDKRTTITDEDLIHRLINAPSDVELSKSDFYDWTGNEMYITFNNEHHSYNVFLNKEFLQIDGTHYRVNGENKLFYLIKNEKLEWTVE
ncbi:DUF4181 domain-containing protein [Ferdinandcohnia sp. Marseille-Q9671]